MALPYKQKCRKLKDKYFSEIIETLMQMTYLLKDVVLVEKNGVTQSVNPTPFNRGMIFLVTVYLQEIQPYCSYYE